MAAKLTKGDELECRVARLLFYEGAFVRRGVDLQMFFDERFTVTDLDVLALDFSPTLALTRTIGECKTTEAKGAPNAADRLLWGVGLQALVGADASFLVTTKAAKDRVRRLAAQLDQALLDERDIARREQLIGIDAGSEYGPHDPQLLLRQRQVLSSVKDDPELKRVYWFVRSEFWFLDPVLGLKRALGASRLLSRRFSARLPARERDAVTWLTQEAMVCFTVALTQLAGECYRQPEDVFARRLTERLSEGLASYHVLERISHEVDRYVIGILADAGLDPGQQVEALGALAPKPPAYAEPLLEVLRRLAHEPRASAELARLLDWRIAAHALARPLATGRRFTAETDAARLLRVIAAFLAGQAKLPDELLRPLREAGPATSAATEPGEDASDAAGANEKLFDNGAGPEHAAGNPRGPLVVPGDPGNFALGELEPHRGPVQQIPGRPLFIELENAGDAPARISRGFIRSERHGELPLTDAATIAPGKRRALRFDLPAPVAGEGLLEQEQLHVRVIYDQAEAADFVAVYSGPEPGRWEILSEVDGR